MTTLNGGKLSFTDIVKICIRFDDVRVKADVISSKRYELSL